MINETHQDSESPRSGRRRWRLGTVALVIAVALALGLQIYSGIRTRVEAETNLQRVTDQAAVAVVDIVHPQVGAPTQEVILPGNMQAFTDTPIYARTSGYLQRWHVDIGARVKQGDLLAEIDTRNRPATAPGAGRSRDRAGQSQPGSNHLRPLAVSA